MSVGCRPVFKKKISGPWTSTFVAMHGGAENVTLSNSGLPKRQAFDQYMLKHPRLYVNFCKFIFLLMCNVTCLDNADPNHGTPLPQEIQYVGKPYHPGN